MTTTIVLMPVGCRVSGRAFGWTTPSGHVVVAAIDNADVCASDLPLAACQIGHVTFDAGARLCALSVRGVELPLAALHIVTYAWPSGEGFYSAAPFTLAPAPSGAAVAEPCGDFASEVVPLVNASADVVAALARARDVRGEQQTMGGWVGARVARTASAGASTLLRLWCALCLTASVALRMRLPTLGVALVDVSATAAQLDARLRALSEVGTLVRGMSGRHARTLRARARYVTAVSSLWLLVNDLLLGHALGALVVRSSASLAPLVMAFVESTSVGAGPLSARLMAAMGWPRGLKLNAPVDALLASGALGGAALWAELARAALPNASLLAALARGAAWVGLSVMLALAQDAIALATLHVRFGAWAARTVLGGQLAMLGTLLLLFRGLKRNALRARTDAHDFAPDQLLVGTLLLALTAGLLPTIAVYACFFTLAQAAIALGCRVLRLVIVLLTDAPLFALLLALRNPQRLPSGVAFVDLTLGSAGGPSQSPTVSRLVSIGPSAGRLLAEFLPRWWAAAAQAAGASSRDCACAAPAQS